MLLFQMHLASPFLSVHVWSCLPQSHANFPLLGPEKHKICRSALVFTLSKPFKSHCNLHSVGFRNIFSPSRVKYAGGPTKFPPCIVLPQ